MIDQTADAIAEILADSFGRRPEVEVGSTITAGANRRTLAISIGGASFGTGDSEPTKAIAQIAERDTEQTWIARVADEAAFLRAAEAVGVPVPPVLAAEASRQLNADVLITGFVEGNTIPRRVLRALGEHDRQGHKTVETMAESCGLALAAIHTIDAARLPVTRPLDRFDPTDYLVHLGERLDELPTPYPTFRFALNVLADNLPDPPPVTSLIHGDFRNGNLIVADGEIKAVLDWELVHLGDPMEDLAWLCLRTWRFGIDDYEVGGFTTVDRLRRAYEKAGGQWRQDAFEWWSMARTVWWGIGLAAQAARFVEGASTSIVHAASGRRVVELEYDLLNLLEPLVN